MEELSVSILATWTLLSFFVRIGLSAISRIFTVVGVFSIRAAGAIVFFAVAVLFLFAPIVLLFNDLNQLVAQNWSPCYTLGGITKVNWSIRGLEVKRVSKHMVSIGFFLFISDFSSLHLPHLKLIDLADIFINIGKAKVLIRGSWCGTLSFRELVSLIFLPLLIIRSRLYHCSCSISRRNSLSILGESLSRITIIAWHLFQYITWLWCVEAHANFAEVIGGVRRVSILHLEIIWCEL